MDTYVCYSPKCRFFDDNFCTLATPRNPVVIKNGKCIHYASKKEEDPFVNLKTERN